MRINIFVNNMNFHNRFTLELTNTIKQCNIYINEYNKQNSTIDNKLLLLYLTDAYKAQRVMREYYGKTIEINIHYFIKKN